MSMPLAAMSVYRPSSGCATAMERRSIGIRDPISSKTASRIPAAGSGAAAAAAKRSIRPATCFGRPITVEAMISCILLVIL